TFFKKALKQLALEIVINVLKFPVFEESLQYSPKCRAVTSYSLLVFANKNCPINDCCFISTTNWEQFLYLFSDIICIEFKNYFLRIFLVKAINTIKAMDTRQNL